MRSTPCPSLFLALHKRWRVEYGGHFLDYRRMAVPYRAKELCFRQRIMNEALSEYYFLGEPSQRNARTSRTRCTSDASVQCTCILFSYSCPTASDMVTKLKVRLSLLLSKQGILRNGRDPVAESGHSGQD